MPADAVGGTNGLIDKLIERVGYNRTTTPADSERIDCLNALEYAEQLIAQSEAMSYLRTVTPITLNSAVSEVALPTDVDFGKDLWLELPDGSTVLVGSRPEEVRPKGQRTYSRVTQTPSRVFVARDSAAAGVRKLYFSPPNASGSAIQYRLIYQIIPPRLTDDAATFSLLPLGYELTLLLPIAEEYIKERRHEIGIETLKLENGQRLQAFYGKFRDNKKTPETDQGQTRRAIEEDLNRGGE